MRIFKVYGFAVFWLLFAWSLDCYATDLNESQIKAAFLYKFTRYVQWPSQLLQGDDDPFVIGVFGENTFTPLLERATKGKQVEGRPLKVRLLKKSDEVEGCHILFISSSQSDQLERIFAQLDSSHTLTVSDGTDFARLGGIVEFVLGANRMQLKINIDAAKRARLDISARLLEMAHTVRDSVPDAGSK